MRVRLDQPTRIGEMVLDQGTVADLSDAVANQLVATGRASLAAPPQPEPTTGPEYRNTRLKDYFKKG